jgi:diguanylate cyclase (GGDEF)-like protein/PAS domain S-box-containing protein
MNTPAIAQKAPSSSLRRHTLPGRHMTLLFIAIALLPILLLLLALRESVVCIHDFHDVNLRQSLANPLTRTIERRAYFEAVAAGWLFVPGMIGIVLTLTKFLKRDSDIVLDTEVFNSDRNFSNAVLDNLNEGILACDAQGRLTVVNAATKRFHGLVDRKVPVINWHAHFCLYKADGSRELEPEELPLVRALAGEVTINLDVLLVTDEGPVRYCIVNAQPIYDETQGRLGAVAVMHDITERRQAEQEATRLANIVECSSDAVIGLNLDGTIVSWNAAATRLYGLKDADIVGRHSSILSPPGEPGPLAEATKALLRGETVEQQEIVLRRKDGDVVDIALRFSPIQDSLGSLVGLSATARDITVQKRAEKAAQDAGAALEVQKKALEEANERLESLATSDGLTGLRNRRAMDTQLEHEFARSNRYKVRLSLLLIDIDRFKTYNDSFGHQAGDDVLRDVAKVLKAGTRETDIVARYGGEEICIILPETNLYEAGRLAERLRSAVASSAWVRRAVTISIGVSTMDATMKSAADLVLAADRALYTSKAEGRNRVTSATTEVSLAA